MELRVLKHFLMVAREENITKAAQLLHVTQPTLSRQLMQLEEELGVQLFHRGKHNVTLTEDGMLLRRRAQELVSLSEKTKMELQHKEEMPTGEIAIGCGETKSMAALSEKMVSFRQKYPLVQFSIYSAIADDIKERLEKGLMVRRELVKNELANWFGDSFDQLEIAATYNLIVNAAFMVEQGLGVALCFDLGAVFENLRFVPLAPRMETGSVLVWKKNQMLSAANALFIQHIRNTI